MDVFAGTVAIAARRAYFGRVHKDALKVRMLPALAAMLLLCGCASTGLTPQVSQQTKMQAALDPWIGQSVASYAAERGNPASQIAVDDATTAFRWMFSGTTAGAIIPVGGTVLVAPPREQTCTVVFYATGKKRGAIELKDFVINRYEWSGAC